MPERELAPGEAHVDWILTAQAHDDVLASAYLALLDEGERARHDRYLFQRSKDEFLVTRALARTTLSRYADVDPRAWRFRFNAYGRPEIDGPGDHAGLRFNLSNTFGLVVCMVARDIDVGVDVEDVERRGQTTAIADRFFSPQEVAALHQVPEQAQRSRFFDYWTLKEAYIKARGMGLAIPLAHFSFSFEADAGGISIGFDPRLDDDPLAWQFWQLRPTERHVISAALRRGRGPDLRVVVRNTVPLVDRG
jgi:4'-phosphopantetheinyl transferase